MSGVLEANLGSGPWAGELEGRRLWAEGLLSWEVRESGLWEPRGLRCMWRRDQRGAGTACGEQEAKGQEVEVEAEAATGGRPEQRVPVSPKRTLEASPLPGQLAQR